MNDLLSFQLSIIVFNIANVFIDAYRILKNKTIAHGINFIAYISFVVFILVVHDFNVRQGLILTISAFFNRQLFFDIPLNLRRGLPWYYQSTANPPQAITDRIERFIFGNDENVGKKIAYAYLIFYCVFINFYVWMF